MAAATFNLVFKLVKENPTPCGATTIAEDGIVAKLDVIDDADSKPWMMEMIARGLFVLVDITDVEDGVGLLWEVRSKPTQASSGVDLVLGEFVDGLTTDGVTPVPDDTLYATIEVDVTIPIQWTIQAIREGWVDYVLQV